MNSVIISVGSNTPDREERMSESRRWLESVFVVHAMSEIYETPEIYGRYAPYLNYVVQVSTELPAERVTAMLKAFERTQGRNEMSKFIGQVPIDLDLVIFNNNVLRPNELNREYFRIGYKQLTANLDDLPAIM